MICPVYCRYKSCLSVVSNSSYGQKGYNRPRFNPISMCHFDEEHLVPYRLEMFVHIAGEELEECFFSLKSTGSKWIPWTLSLSLPGFLRETAWPKRHHSLSHRYFNSRTLCFLPVLWQEMMKNLKLLKSPGKQWWLVSLTVNVILSDDTPLKFC